jgi:hypothetical protein
MGCVYLGYDIAVFFRLLRESLLLADLRQSACPQTVKRIASDQGQMKFLSKPIKGRAKCSACKNASGIC